MVGEIEKWLTCGTSYQIIYVHMFTKVQGNKITKKHNEDRKRQLPIRLG
jgi:hypothetical protein